MIEAYQSHAHLSLGPEYAPMFENMSKEEQDMMDETYGDEVGKQYAMSLQNFVADCPGTGGLSIKSSVSWRHTWSRLHIPSSSLSVIKFHFLSKSLVLSEFFAGHFCLA